MALSLTFVIFILWGATISNAITHAGLTTRAPITSAQTTTEVKEAGVQEYASMINYFILIYLKFAFVNMTRPIKQASISGWICTILWLDTAVVTFWILVKLSDLD